MVSSARWFPPSVSKKVSNRWTGRVKRSSQGRTANSCEQSLNRVNRSKQSRRASSHDGFCFSHLSLPCGEQRRQTLAYEYDNPRSKTFDEPHALPAQSTSHSARPRLLWAFATSASDLPKRLLNE